jgi:iron complex outermembrane receptor protein
VSATVAGCESITPTILTGGKPNLGPETTKQGTLGVVFAPTPWLSGNIDYWEIRRNGTILSLPLTTLLSNYGLFTENFLRDSTGKLVSIDTRWVNAGETITKGLEIGAKANTNAWGGKISASIDGTYMIERKSRVVASAAFGTNEVGRFSRSGDIPLRWKHVASVSFEKGPWTGTLTQLFSFGYYDAVLPGVANGTVVPPNWSAKTQDYSRFNVSLTYSGIKNLGVTVGVKNIFNTDPPFSAAYDGNTGAGSSWEPRVADPRGRAYTILATYSFK